MKNIIKIIAGMIILGSVFALIVISVLSFNGIGGKISPSVFKVIKIQELNENKEADFCWYVLHTVDNANTRDVSVIERKGKFAVGDRLILHRIDDTPLDSK